MNFTRFRRRRSKHRSQPVRLAARPFRARSPGYNRAHRIELLEDRRVLSAPGLAPIDDVTVLTGAPLHIALDGSDTDHDALSYSVTSTNPDLKTFIPEGNRSMRISVADHGEMVFELFEQRAPNVTAQIIGLANREFYNGLTFHRVIQDFMIQGGDPAGDGTGGPGFQFDDEFHPDLQHTSKGILSMAKSGDDTNGSQFFITAGPTRHLDFNHSIFGFLTEGDAVRQSIAGVEVGDRDKPQSDVVMSSVEIFTDVQNAVLMLSADEGTSGTAVVTVTVSDGTSTAQRSFNVSIEPDDDDPRANADPFLLPVADVHTTIDTPVSFALPGVDVEGDSIVYGGYINPSHDDLAIEVSEADGLATITPSNGFFGVHEIVVGVRSEEVAWQAGDSRIDTQSVPLFVEPAAPRGVEMPASADTGSEDDDGITNLNNSPGNTLNFRVLGAVPGAEVRVLADGLRIGEATVPVVEGTPSSSIVIPTSGNHTLSDGEHKITAVQSMGSFDLNVGNRHQKVDLVSQVSPALTITVDATGPQITSPAGMNAKLGQPYTYDVQTDDEESGRPVTYQLTTSPAGMLIDQASGQITWIPQPGQGPTEEVVVLATDRAGNKASQQFNIVLGDLPQIDFWELPDQVAQDGFRHAFQVVRNGRLTVEALFSHAAGDVDLTLFGAQGVEILRSASQTDNERLDLLVNAGQIFEFLITGNNPQVTYRVTNLLVDRVGKLNVYGTDGDDTFEIIAGSSQRVTVNGVSYDEFIPETGQTIEVDGLGGADRGSVVGTTADEVAGLWPTSAELAGPAHQVNLINVSSITIDGVGGHDVADFGDSAGDDDFGANWNGATLTGDGFSSQVRRFAEVRVDAGAGGFDTAKLFDSPGDDALVATPTYAGLSGDGFQIEIRHFQAVHVYASGGGLDTARLYDSVGNDTLYGSPTEGTLYGAGFYNRTKHFEAVHAFATAGGTDSAELYDSPGDDTFFGGFVEAALYGVGFFNRAKFFEEVSAHADAGGTDTAELYDSPGNDTFVVSPGFGEMSGEGFSVEAVSFDTISGIANSGGADLAKMHDSPGDDTFAGSPRGSQLSGDGFSNLAKLFEDVQVFGASGGLNVAKLYDSPGDDRFVASPGYGKLSGDRFSLEVEAFFAVHAYATAGGNDRAELNGSDADDVFHGAPDEGALFNHDYYSRAKFFEEVHALGGEGHDVANMFDSPSNDNFNGGPLSSTLFAMFYEGPYGTGYSNQAESFEEVRAYATGGGNNLAELKDSPGDDFLVVAPGYAALSGDGFFLQAEAFVTVVATGDAGGLDEAKVFDSPADDTFRGWPAEAELSGNGFFNRVLNYDGVHVYATAGGRDTAFLFDSPENDQLHGTPEASALFGPGFYNRAKFFEEVYAQAGEGGDDEAFLFDSEGVDLLEAKDDWAKLSNEVLDFLYEARGFPYVQATATSHDDTKLVPSLDELLFTLDLKGTWQESPGDTASAVDPEQ